jgi:cytidine deaminase
MERLEKPFTYLWYPDAGELPEKDLALLEAARKATGLAYAPYSGFRVGAALALVSGDVVTGANQENASFPAGLCAERVALASAAARFPGVAVAALAVSYDAGPGASDRPISPCGICRQSLAEWEQRFGSPIRIILGGLKGGVQVIASASTLLPLSFSREDLPG